MIGLLCSVVDSVKLWEWMTSTKTAAIISAGSFFIGITGMMAAIVAVRWARAQHREAVRANELAERIAKAGGTFQHPDLVLSVYEESSTTEFVLALPVGDVDCCFEVPLPYCVHNMGKATAQDVEIFLRANKEVRFAGSLTIDPRDANLKQARGGLASETEHTATTVTSLQTIHPQQCIEIADILSIRKATSSKHTRTVKGRNGKPMRIAFWIGYAYTLDYVILQKDRQPITRSFRYSVIDTTGKSVKKAIEAFNSLASSNDPDADLRAEEAAVTKVVLLVPDTKKVTERAFELPNRVVGKFRILTVDGAAITKYTGTKSASKLNFPTLDYSAKQRVSG
jgi:hypothetical protein